jgi:hypothetical protein
MIFLPSPSNTHPPRLTRCGREKLRGAVTAPPAGPAGGFARDRGLPPLNAIDAASFIAVRDRLGKFQAVTWPPGKRFLVTTRYHEMTRRCVVPEWRVQN